LRLKLARVSADLTDSAGQTVAYCRTGTREGSVSKCSSCPWNNVI